MSFETRDVRVPTTTWVQGRLAEQRGGWIHGGTGTGKSHAVRAAVNGGISIDVGSGPLLGQRFAVDLARQLGAAGRRLLEAVRHEGLAAALALATASLATTPLLVNGVEHLMGAAPSLEDPTAALWQEDRRTVLDWLKGRLEQTPTILVGRGRPEPVDSTYRRSQSRGAGHHPRRDARRSPGLVAARVVGEEQPRRPHARPGARAADPGR